MQVVLQFFVLGLLNKSRKTVREQWENQILKVVESVKTSCLRLRNLGIEDGRGKGYGNRCD